MVSKVSAKPFAGEAQWVIDVTTQRLLSVSDVPSWYATCPIPALQNRTAADLVRTGNARAVVS